MTLFMHGVFVVIAIFLVVIPIFYRSLFLWPRLYGLVSGSGPFKCFS